MPPVYWIDTRAFVSNCYILDTEDSSQEESDNSGQSWLDVSQMD